MALSSMWSFNFIKMIVSKLSKISYIVNLRHHIFYYFYTPQQIMILLTKAEFKIILNIYLNDI